MAVYTFGAFQLNQNSGGLGLFFIEKNLDLPKVKPAEFPIARRAGATKSGEFIESRQIDVLLKVAGSSRTDLISRLDTLQQSLALRGQQLCVHEDSRYFQSVDCISADAKFKIGKIVSCDVPIIFRAYDPIAYSNSSSSYDSGTVALTLSSGVYNFPAINITGGGTTFGYPLIHLINKTSGTHQWTALTISQTQDSQTLTCNSTGSVPLPANLNDYVDIQCDPAVGYSIQTNSSGKYSDPSGLFPVVESGTTTFNIGITSPSAVSAEVIISWRSRYLS